MPNLSIKDVPVDWTEALRKRAARNHRSLQGELMAMVEWMVTDVRQVPEVPKIREVRSVFDAVNLASPGHSGTGNFAGKASAEGDEKGVEKGVVKTAVKGAVVGYDRRGQPITQRGWKSVDQVLASIRARYPDRVDSGPNSLEIIRAEREARDEQLNRVR